MKTEQEILNAFKGVREDGGLYGRIGRYQGHLYATQGHVCVRIPDEPSIKSDDDFGYSWQIEHLLQSLPATPYAKISLLDIQLPDAKSCEVCNGTGRVLECSQCQGEGCKKCNDYGTVPCVETVEYAPPCWLCEGSKENLHNPVVVGHTHFNRRYLKLIASLENAELLLTADPTGTQFFRFDGGLGAIMPTRT